MPPRPILPYRYVTDTWRERERERGKRCVAQTSQYRETQRAPRAEASGSLMGGASAAELAYYAAGEGVIRKFVE